ncbi:MAG: hypothetical protein C5S48_00245 [Candidatus Methanogaster sp.]|nr:MAG: hypothetical protein C5S48_00245 [ANME-2 cluster archaeon]
MLNMWSEKTSPKPRFLKATELILLVLDFVIFISDMIDAPDFFKYVVDYLLQINLNKDNGMRVVIGMG